MNEGKPAIVAICGGCKRFVFAGCKESLSRKDKNLLGRLAADGHEVKTITVEKVRNGDWGCECKKGVKP